MKLRIDEIKRTRAANAAKRIRDRALCRFEPWRPSAAPIIILSVADPIT